MSMRDQIADIIKAKFALPFWEAKAADAILAALPDMIAPLVWEDNSAYSALGMYKIEEYKNLCFSWGLNEDDLWTHGTEADSLEQAKAAANTHHRAAIMAAFTGETTT
jgi:hypothetical protein